ncbi:hypothetical protein LTR36_002932 [Oleoguttula mirabilis]|uniref:Myb-like domain-containing protein n=1 Tax=Oleoguttula mirabilis TaxID=1507867 RepID=A0AAV9JJI1_9PEZI|nr:hypothetical protein LTR36_002932 [Oleoguttula mirabilis]
MDMNFQTFLQTQGMSNNYPSQTFLSAPRRRTTAQATPFVSYTPQQHHGTMANTHAQPSFFADEMYHHRDEPAVFEEMAHQPLAALPQLTTVGFRPLLPSAPGPGPVPSAAVAPAFLRKNESIAPLVIPGVLGSHVDNAQYTPILPNDWTRASIDYDYSSPASVDTHAISPLTPGTDGSGSFTEHYFKSEFYSNNAVAADFAAKHFSNPFGATMYPGAMPSPFVAPPHVPYHEPTAFVPVSGLPLSGGYMMQAAMASQGGEAGQGQHHHHMPPLAFQSTPEYQELELSDDDLYELDQTSDAEDEAETPHDADESASRNRHRSTVSERQQQHDRDTYLVRMRRRGISYRDIKRGGRFREAESTLRGRYRVLTKDKGERVRSPKWTAEDERLLREAVEHCSRNGKGAAASRKIPWKRVSEYVKSNGGTYLFAPATCARKWDALQDADA